MDISQVAQTAHRPASGESRTPVAESPARQADARAGDAVALSDEAVFLNQLDQGGIEWGRSFTTNPPIPRTLNEIRDWVTDYQDGLRSRVEQIFQQDGVSLEQDLQVGLAPSGQVQADPGHPQADAAQQALDQHPELGAQLQAQQQRQQLAQVLNIGGELNRASDGAGREAGEQALAQQLGQPQGYQLTIPAHSSNDPTRLAQQA